MNELLGVRIKTLRRASNFSQEQMADRIGISRQKYARIERGNNNITLEVLTQIAKILNLHVRDITKVLDEMPIEKYREKTQKESSEKIFDMLDLLYANKHLYVKLI